MSISERFVGHGSQKYEQIWDITTAATELSRTNPYVVRYFLPTKFRVARFDRSILLYSNVAEKGGC